jgi:hypothetical protein
MSEDRGAAYRQHVERALESRLADRDRISARLLECESRVAFAVLRAEAAAVPDGRCASALRDWEALWHRFNDFDAAVRAAAAVRGRRARLGPKDAAAVDRLLTGPAVNDPDAAPSLVAETPKLTLDAAATRMEDRYQRVRALVDEIEAALDAAAGEDLPALLAGLAARERELVERWRAVTARISEPPVSRPRTRAKELSRDLGRLPGLGEPGWADTVPARNAVRAAIDAAAADLDDAFAEVERPLRERNRMRSEAQALLARAERLGLAAEPGFATAWRHARALLWTAPCSLPEARAALDALAPRLHPSPRERTE